MDLRDHHLRTFKHH
jgi:uncharacterized damage-inducible protein DinB